MNYTKVVTLRNGDGFHARPAGLFVKKASEFKAQVRVKMGIQEKNGKSVMALMSLGAKGGSELTIETSGEDAEPALQALAALIEGNFQA